MNVTEDKAFDQYVCLGGAFSWASVVEGSTTCEWNGYQLSAMDTGRWYVFSPDGDCLTSYANQAKGETIQDAQRRAQAAAMVLHQLLSKNK